MAESNPDIGAPKKLCFSSSFMTRVVWMPVIETKLQSFDLDAALSHDFP